MRKIITFLLTSFSVVVFVSNVLAQDLFKEDATVLKKFYKVNAKTSEEFLEVLGEKRRFLKKGGEINIDKTAKLILKNWLHIVRKMMFTAIANL